MTKMSKMTEAAKERRDYMISLYEQGLTYSQIAKMVGISHQRVFQLIGGRVRPHPVNITPEQCVYDGLRRWMNDSNVSVGELIRRIYGYTHAELYQRVRLKLRGEVDITRTFINQILAVTDMTYEYAFGTQIDATE